MENKSYKALLFDFDGTLFDTKDLNYKAYSLAYFDLGIEITRDMFAKTDGLSVYDFNRAMGVECDVEKLRELKARYYAKYSLYATPNEYLLNVIETTELKTALVTTARWKNILPLLDKYNLVNKFYSIVTQEDVKNHKPSPDAYIKTINNLGLNAEDCLAFEDSRPGFVSARRAKIDCVRVKNFEKDCIRDMSGGSDSTTKLLWSEENSGLVVEKRAVTPQAIQRLKAQYESLQNFNLPKESENYNFVLHHYIKPLSAEFTETSGYYTMPFVFANTLYEYKDRISIFFDVLCGIYRIFLLSQTQFVRDEVRKKSWERYIVPGLKIYTDALRDKVGSRNVRVNLPYKSWKQIPDFVDFYKKSTYHGDTTFENILVRRNSKILLIDPVPDGNVVQGILHDFAKIGQSLMGYEAIRDGVEFDYSVEKQIFNDFTEKFFAENDRWALKFHIACLFFRRLKHQVEQRPELVIPYGNIALQLLTEFSKGEYQL